jgi:hypothetical protein
MANFFDSVHITNFKSLKDVTLSDCKRINLLIGKPNVGKSNILEAIGLFGLGYSGLNKNKQLSQFVRFENEVISISLNDNDQYRRCDVQYLGANTENLSKPDLVDKLLAVKFSNADKPVADEFNMLFVNNKHDIVQILNLLLLSNVKQYKFLNELVLEKQYMPSNSPVWSKFTHSYSRTKSTKD